MIYGTPSRNRNLAMSTRNRPLVTIAITTYNRAHGYLKDALRSAVSQTYPVLEIIVADNGSTDDTQAVVRGVGDPRIRYFRHATNIRANDNFNFCLTQARGAYFLLLHDDDMIDPDFVEACMDAVGDDTTIGMIRSGTRVIDAAGAVLSTVPNRTGGLSTADFMLGWFAGKTALYVCSTLFNTTQLRELGGFQSKTFAFQDVVAQMTLAARYGRADVIDVKATFRQHGGNMGANRFHDWVEDSSFLLDRMCELAPEERRAEVRSKGLAYFSRTNYRHAGRISSVSQRLGAFFFVYGRFGYTYSPMRYLARSLWSLPWRLKHRLKAAALPRTSGR